MKKREMSDLLVVGFALFAMFFGAGNLIFPPLLGFITGEKWLETFIAFAITGIGLPMLGIFALGKCGGDFRVFTRKLHPLFGVVVGAIIMLEIGPLIAIPRTAATTFEISVLPFAPKASRLVASVVFFVAVLFIAISRNKVIDSVGKYLTPVLAICLVLLIVKAFITPLGDAVKSTETNFFRRGFLEGYQTMDALASLLFATIVVKGIRSRGYNEEKDVSRLCMLSGVVAAMGLLFVYGGLMYAGAKSGSVFSGDVNRTELLIGIADGLWGVWGKVILAVAMGFACFTTAVGLVATAGNYFEELTGGKLNYPIIVVLTCMVSGIFSVNNVDSIIAAAFPFLNALYPLCIYLIIMNLLSRFIPNDFCVVGGTVGTLLVSISESLVMSEDLLGVKMTYLKNVLAALPLSNVALSWVVPALIGTLLFGVIAGLRKKKD